MRDGEIVQVGTAEEILSNPANDYVAQFVADVDRTRVLTAASVMERPKVVMQIGSGPRMASRAMRDAQVSGAYVVDRNRVLRGVIGDSDTVNAIKSGAETLTDLVNNDIFTVNINTPLAEIFAPSAESSLPVPVTDDDGRLLGVIPRVTLLEAMVPNETSGDDQSTTTGNGPSVANGVSTIAELEQAGALSAHEPHEGAQA